MKKLYLLTAICVSVAVMLSCSNTPHVELDVVLAQRVYSVEYPENEKFEFRPEEWQRRSFPDSFYKDNNVIISLQRIYTDNDWLVSIEDNKVMVAERTNYYRNRFRFDVYDGYFVNTYEYSAEVEGSLEFIGNDGVSYIVLETDPDADIHSLLFRVNPRHMFSVNGNIFLFEGISSRWGSGTRGNLYRIEKTDGRWQAVHELDLGGYPITFTFDGEYIYVAVYLPWWDYNYFDGYPYGATEIIRIGILAEALEIERLAFVPHELWSLSMVKQGDTVYVGLGYGVVTVNLSDGSSQFYTKG
jgi:hypothetical protein